jgi:hypothetical protein
MVFEFSKCLIQWDERMNRNVSNNVDIYIKLWRIREASHIDFVHEKRHMFVSLETPHPPLETSHIVIDMSFL